MTTYKCNDNYTYTENDGKDDEILGYPHHSKVIYITGSPITKNGEDCSYWLDSHDERDIAKKGYAFDDFHDARFREDKSEQFLFRRLTPNLEIRIRVSLDNDGVVGEIRFYGKYSKQLPSGEYGEMLIALTGVCSSVWSAILDIERKLDEIIQKMSAERR